MAEVIDQLRAIRDNWLTLVVAEQQAMLTSGLVKPTYSIGDLSYSWTEWYVAVMGPEGIIDGLTKQIASLESSWEEHVQVWC